MSEAAVKYVRDYLNFLRGKGIPVSFGVAYGQEGGDVAVVVVSPAFGAGAKQQNIDLLWQLSGSRIVPIPCGVKQWEEDSVSALIAVARLNGERINL
jgi:hypothetical protein